MHFPSALVGTPDSGLLLRGLRRDDRCQGKHRQHARSAAAPICIQDEDTLDTWFSSALWPFSTLGWPEKTQDYEYFYPTDVLVTGYDIIFFWVIRMVFSGHRADRAKCPSTPCLIHGLVRDSQGRKMSKSLGNGIDPLEVIDKYGADALRMTLVTGNAPGQRYALLLGAGRGQPQLCQQGLERLPFYHDEHGESAGSPDVKLPDLTDG